MNSKNFSKKLRFYNETQMVCDKCAFYLILTINESESIHYFIYLICYKEEKKIFVENLLFLYVKREKLYNEFGLTNDFL